MRVSPDASPVPSLVLRFTGAVLILLAAVALAGRIAGSYGWAEVIPGGQPMVANAAACQIALGVGLWLLALGRWTAALACGAVILGVASLTGLEWAFGVSLGLDELLLRHSFPPPMPHPGRMAPNTVVSFALAGGMLMVAARAPRHGVGTLPVLAGVLCGVCLLAVLSFVTGLQLTLIQELNFGMSLASAVSLLLFAVVLLLGPSRYSRTTQVALPLGVVALILLSAAGLLALMTVRAQREAAAGVVRSYDVVGTVNYLELCLTRMQSAARNYARVRDPEDRAFYERFDAIALRTRRDLGSLIGGDPLHLVALHRLDDVVRRNRALLREQLEAADRSGDAALQSPSRDAEGQALMGELRSAVDAIEGPEHRRQREQSEQSRRGAEQTERIIILGSVLAAVLALCALALTLRAEHARTQAETERARRDEQMRFIFDTMPVGLRWLRQTGGRREIMVNAAHEQITGVTRDQGHIPGIYEQRTHPDDLPRQREGRRAVTQRLTDRFLTEKRYVHADGRVVWASVAWVRRWPGDGADFEEISAVVDITERKAAEAAVRENEERLARIFSAMAEGLVVQDASGAIVVCNAAAQRILGLPEAEILGRTWADARWGLVRPDGTPLPEHEHPALATQRTGSARHGVEIGLRRPDGTRLWISTNCEPLADADGRQSLVVCSFADVTERRQLLTTLARARDQALAASRLKSEFLANVSHEIRTPMNGIIGMVNLLLEQQMAEEQRQMVRLVQQSADSLMAIINDLLDFAKIEAGRMRIETLEFEPRQVIGDVLALLVPRAQVKGLRLEADFDDGCGVRLQGDPGRIRQVMLNLLGNAVKFTERGGVRAVLRCRGETADRVTLRVEVHDTGIGIPRQAAGMLFQPFTQADGTTTRRFGGTGLGLAISRQLVELMGGTIGFESEEGRGSVFWFELELPKAAGVPAPRRTAEPRVLRTGRRLRLLLAEDNSINQIVARQSLERLGHEVEIAPDGAVALARLGVESFDAVLMDCQMPVIDGFGATRRIRAGEVPGADPRIPIIALTAYAHPEDRRRCLAAGMDDYLTKPLRIEALAEALERCVSGRAEGRAAPLAPNGTVLDEVQLAQLRELPGTARPQLLDELLDIFLQDAPALLRSLGEMAEAGRGAELEAAAHRLAGSASNLGALAFRDAALAVEAAARDQDWAVFPARRAALEREWERLRSALEAISSGAT